MLLPGYDLLFGKPSLRGLFNDHFVQAGTVNAGFMLKMLEDPNVNLTATVSSVKHFFFSFCVVNFKILSINFPGLLQE